MIIREARSGDGMTIATIQVVGWQAAYLGIIPPSYLDEMRQGLEQRAGFWEKTIRDPSGWVMVAEGSEKAMLGWASGGPARDADAKDVTELYALYVVPEHWGKGGGPSWLP
jgi:GNAT superfamily N-acetyltransferase